MHDQPMHDDSAHDDSAQQQENAVNRLNTPERRAMASISTPAGHMLIVAGDQRNSMKAVMNAPGGPSSITTDELAEAKADLVRYLGNHAPAILLDPEVALPALVDEGVLSRDTALVVGMDASGFETVDGLRYTQYVEGVTPHRVRELGGGVAKMLFYVRSDRQVHPGQIIVLVQDIVVAAPSKSGQQRQRMVAQSNHFGQNQQPARPHRI